MPAAAAAAAAEHLMDVIKQQPKISLQSLEFAVRSSGHLLATALSTTNPQHNQPYAAAAAAAAQQLLPASTGASSADANAARCIQFATLPVSQILAIKSLEVCQSLLKEEAESAEIDLTLPLSEIYSLTMSCLKLARVATAVELAAATGNWLGDGSNSSGGSSSSSSSGSTNDSSSSSTASGNLNARSAQEAAAVMALEAGMLMFGYEHKASRPEIVFAAANLRYSSVEVLTCNAAAIADWFCKGLMPIGKSLCLFGDACTLLGGQQPASYVAAAAGAAQAAALVGHAAAAVPIQLGYSGSFKGLVALLDRVEYSVGHFARRCWPGAGPLLGIAAGAAGQHQQQQLSEDLQELLACIPAVKAAVKAVQSSESAVKDEGAAQDSSSCCAATSALLLDLGQRLVCCGDALAALCPVPLCCNNPGCVELRGSSEQQLVGGKGTLCSKCR
jgi:hypothetical protein